MIEVAYESDDLIAINKPHGLLVHRSKIAADAKEFALQKVRDYVGHKVFLCHRLDRKTSGVLLFAKSSSVNAQIQEQFAKGEIQKTYLALVRGFIEDGTIDYPIGEEGKPLQNAITHFSVLKKYEIELPFGKFDTSRYSLVKVEPKTGRFHQIRKHFAHVFHPILGDRPHGCNKQNRLWKEKFGMTDLLLHAQSLDFKLNEEVFHLEADMSSVFKQTLSWLNKRNIIQS